MTPYDALRRACGLSHQEAARFHGLTSDQQIGKWCRGGAQAPPGVIAELRDLFDAIEAAAAEAADLINAQAVPADLGYPADDHEARQLGLPCVGAWRAMAGLLIAWADHPVALVPRGSTPSTARAADLTGL